MPTPQQFLNRLDEIGASLARSEHALALIGLGSVGQELERLDAYSDLDFFAVVEAGFKPAYLADLGWLSAVAPVVYAFPNTLDGYKLMFADGIFCEFAVFEPVELRQAAFAPGRMVWKRAGAEDLPTGSAPAARPAESRATEWLVGEALTNLYVGLGRYRRGEKLSAQRFIQHYAVDRLLELAARVEDEQAAQRDPFANERRFEQRFPATAALLPRFVPGYDHTPQAALEILAFLEAHFEVNAFLAQAVRRLAG